MFCEKSVKTGPIHINIGPVIKKPDIYFLSKKCHIHTKTESVHIMTDINTSGTQIKSCKTSHILLLSSHILRQVGIIKFNCLL